MASSSRTPGPAERARGEILSLTGLRGVAALVIFFHHARHKLEAVFPDTSFDFLIHGYLAVDVFFVLSGFVISYSYATRIGSPAEFGHYLLRRFARLYPLYAVSTLAVVGMVQGALAAGWQIHRPARFSIDHHLLIHLTMTQAWGWEQELRYNLPSWSVSAEIFAYLLFPALWVLTSRIGRTTTALAAALASTLLTVFVLRFLGFESLHVPSQGALVRVTGEFLAGLLSYRAWSRNPTIFNTVGRAVETLAIMVIAVIFFSPLADPLMSPGAVVLVYVLARGGGPLTRILATPFMLWLGRISYSLYLTHFPVLSVLERVLPVEIVPASDPARLAFVALHLAIALVVAAAAYHGIEEPGRRWLLRSTKKKRQERGMSG